MDVDKLIIPATLATLLKKVPDLPAVHSPMNNVQQTTQNISGWPVTRYLPHDIDDYPFSKFVRQIFQGGTWGYTSNPIAGSVLGKGSDPDCVILNRLILRYMLDDNLKGKSLKFFADYIICNAQRNPVLSDELICQVVSQTWCNTSDNHHDRVWRLLSHLLSGILPSSQLFPYLLKYVSDQSNDYYKGHFQTKLLQSPVHTEVTLMRSFPPSVLEWEANNNCYKMALEVCCSDDTSVFIGYILPIIIGVDSWSTAGDLAHRTLSTKGLPAMKGWTLAIQYNDGFIHEESGDDYVMDLVSNIELNPEIHQQIVAKNQTILSYGQYTLNEEELNGSYEEEEEDEVESIGSPPPSSRSYRSDSVFHDRSFHEPTPPATNSNFSFGPPNLKFVQTHRDSSIHRPSMDQSASNINKRLKGGGSMMRGKISWKM
uniref:unconventional myosin-XV-like n=1 Tax=Ciona intestinalis TaxID=7719 RepID=UPI00089DC548|nr:unconventional myosin-XV-like [Ciona intestinalis]|eukprot:XP_002121286.3 unconventional myosin-XV-like [Ciona intestinalis]